MTDYRTILAAITADPRYLSNLDWGDPRPGHPEGSVRAHIAELEANLDALRPKLSDDEAAKLSDDEAAKLSDDEVAKLRLLIHVHDTFKPEAKEGVPIAHPQSHASLARAFLAEFHDDPDLLAMVQFHDEPFALYRQVENKGTYNRARFESLLNSIRDWNLFLAFNLIDGCTAGKSRDPLRWLFRELTGKVESRFTESDILP